jgi:hypothetical protein
MIFYIVRDKNNLCRIISPGESIYYPYQTVYQIEISNIDNLISFLKTKYVQRKEIDKNVFEGNKLDIFEDICLSYN